MTSTNESNDKSTWRSIPTFRCLMLVEHNLFTATWVKGRYSPTGFSTVKKEIYWAPLSSVDVMQQHQSKRQLHQIYVWKKKHICHRCWAFSLPMNHAVAKSCSWRKIFTTGIQKSSSELNLFHASYFNKRNSNSEQKQIWLKQQWSQEETSKATLSKSNTFSATYFCWRLAPFCCTLSGWMLKVAFL